MGSSACDACPSGQYSDEEAVVTACKECPPGLLCNASAIIDGCEPTTYSTAGSSECTECAAGFYTTANNSSTCLECDAGNKCINGNISQCDVGEYQPSQGQTACLSCAAGYFCDSVGTQTPTECDPGKYSSERSTVCTDCDPGYACARAYDAPVQCESGTFSTGLATKCSNCSQGWYAAAPGLSECTECIAGFYCPSIASGPLPCANHTTSEPGAVICIVCGVGSYQDPSDASQCVACDAGYACTLDAVQECPAGTFAASGASVCTKCAEGYYIDTPAASACLECPQGYQCADPAVPVACADGFYSNSVASVECEPCPAGLHCPDGAHAVPCLLGEYSPIGDSFCRPCPTRHTCSSPTQQPLACPDGQYSPSGDWACHECPAGFSCNLDQDELPVQCPEGSYSPASSTSCEPCVDGNACPTDSGSTMVACPPGYFAEGGAAQCSPCPINHYCPVATTAPILCPEGMFTPISGSVKCQLCPAGYECELNSDATNTTLTICPVGQYSHLGSASCSNCGSGNYCPEGSATPHPCPGGYYQNRVQRSVCKSCPAGSECPGRGASFDACAPGQYSLARQSSCTECPVGHECPDLDAEPQVCVAGKFSEGSQTACSGCQAGFYCPDITAALRIPCPWGTYQPSSDQYACAACPTDFSCTSDSATMCQNGKHSPKGHMDCTSCPAGFNCEGPDPQDQEPCAPGEFAFEGACTECSAGLYSTIGLSECLTCPAGRHSQVGAGECLECPAGYACPPGDNTEPDLCGFGHFSRAGASECSECMDGSFCPPGSTSASPRGQTVDCELGYYCDNSVVAASQWTTAAGGFDTRTSSEPTPCAPGKYGVYEGAFNESTGCHDCPAGTFCPAHVLPDGGFTLRTAIPCPRGFYCPAGSITPQPCPERSYSFMEGARNESQCMLCPQGYYCTVPDDYDNSVHDYSMVPHRGGQGTYYPQGRNGFPCPAGTYSGGEVYDSNGIRYNASGGSNRETAMLTNLRQCLNCTAGHYCPEESHVPRECPAGKYQPYQGAHHLENCLPCDPGYACPEGGMTASRHVVCSPGHYCPPGTVNPDDFPCPAGKYSDSITLFHEGFRLYKSDGDCKLCPPFFACPEGTGGLPIDYTDGSLPSGFDTNFGLRSGVSMLACEPGYYCPPGTTFTTEFPCPAGKYSDSDHIRDQEECIICPAGQFCDEASTSSDIQACPGGFFCPAGTSSSTVVPCPVGTYDDESASLQSTDECLNCTLGHFCDEEGMTTADLNACPPGKHQNETGTSVCKDCDAGWFCAGTGNVNASMCLPGAFSGTGVSQCEACTAGYFCESNTETVHTMLAHPCEAGTYCDSGTKRMPDRRDDACPIGYYCPEAVASPVPCPSGSWGNHTGLAHVDDCTTCNPGYYCAGTDAHPALCQAGCFCPEGSDLRCPFKCPAGMYRPNEGGRYLSDACSVCPPGTYCPDEGTTSPTLCPNASYCPRGSIRPEECPAGKYLNSTGNQRVDDCIDCPAGQYCRAHSDLPTGPCQEGFFCSLGADSDSPARDRGGGNICPRGHYCPPNSGAPLSCPEGTYNDAEGATNVSFCSPCPPGMFCMGTSNQVPDDVCHDGYFCISESFAVTPRDAVTAPGAISQAGAWNYTLCPPGKYNDEYAQSLCKGCPEGTYCPDFGLTWPLDCPQGYFCPANSTEDIPPCPRGTYGASPSLSQESECTVCPAGSFCSDPNLTAVSGLCNAGFFCPQGSVDPYGRDALCPDHVTNRSNECPPGFFCPVGSSEGTPCPLGSYSNITRAGSIDDCILCDVGYYCDAENLTAPAGECDPGFYCLRNVSTPMPTEGVVGAEGSLQTGGDLCPAGKYCPRGTFSPIPCPEGTFSNETGLHSANCSLCAEGFYCDEGSPGTICPEGHYCPAGTNSSVPKCPMGTYLPYTGATNLSECLDCPGGRYCPPGTGSDPPTCSEGFFCTDAVVTSTPYDGAAVGNGGVCSAGSYCPANVTIPVPCPEGTFGNTTFAKVESDCTTCTPGKFCNTTGLTAPVADCHPGYYCPAGSINGTAIVAPRGYFTTSGAHIPTQCPPGTFANETGRVNCTSCPEAFYCPESATVEPSICPAGYYCPPGTNSSIITCPPGTFSNTTGLRTASDCLNCTAGFYCPGNEGATSPEGACEPGYTCAAASVDRFGHSATDLLFDCDDDGDDAGDGLDLEAYECAAGRFCPNGGSGYPCPIGTYSNKTGLRKVSECTLCDPGMFCNTTGLLAPAGPCAAGFQCVRGAMTSEPTGPLYMVSDANGSSVCSDDGFAVCVQPWLENSAATEVDVTDDERAAACAVQLLRLDNAVDENAVCHCECAVDMQGLQNAIGGALCPIGYFCPEGTPEPIPCPPSTFGGAAGLATESSCSNCTAGFFCDEYAHTPTNFADNTCPAGSYCPEGSALPTPCIAGTYNPTGSSSSDSDCLACDPGRYCIGGEADVTGPCAAGFYCVGGAAKATPSDEVTEGGDVCWDGWQCAEGASVPTPCAAGFYCLDAFAHLSAEKEPCAPGFYCANGSFTPTPWNVDIVGEYGFHVGDVCPQGSFCDEQSVKPTACPAGTFSAIQGTTSEAACSACTPGFVCSDGGLELPFDACPQGYFCPGGAATVGDAIPCEAGHRCTGGNEASEPCPGGTFTDSVGKSVCTSCKAGFQCPADAGGNQNEENCVAGSFCPVNTSNPRRNVCPIGTYSSPSTNAEDVGDCLACAAGAFCNVPASTHAAAGGVCPAGYYCPAGTSVPHALPCPVGKYSPAEGLVREDQCLGCPAGQYCEFAGGSAPTGNCSAGFYCSGNASVFAPTFFVGDGDAADTDPSTGGVCPPGTYCPAGSANATICPRGHFCPTQSSVPSPCKAGTYNAGEAAPNSSYCVLCDAGHYCVEGSFEPVPCPTGTYTTAEGNEALSFCSTCHAGFYCEIPEGSNTSVEVPCDEGYYCPAGQSASTFRCPPGYFCPAGASEPTPCDPSYFQPLTLQTSDSSCTTCPSGYFCPEAGMATPEVCPRGHYCGIGSVSPTSCPAGTFSKFPGQGSINTCAQCEAGTSCSLSGRATVGQLCEPGFYCLAGNSLSATPNDCAYGANLANCTESSKGGGFCKAGVECGAGTSTPDGEGGCSENSFCEGGPPGHAQDCPPGKYQHATNQSACQECLAGHFCAPTYFDAPGENNSIALPEARLQPCPNGTYNPLSGSVAIDACLTCPSGYVCGNAASATEPCPGGYYCPEKTTFATICPSSYYCPDRSGQPLPCPVDFYCPEGTSEPIQCGGGTYCPGRSAFETPCPAGKYTSSANLSGNIVTDGFPCRACPGGFYCTEGATNATICPEGYFCEAGSSFYEACPRGYSCPEGSASPVPCTAGYYCPLASDATGFECPLGTYCPAGSFEPTPCPLGYFDDGTHTPRNSSQFVCLICEAGTAGDDDNRSKCNECSPGHVCLEGCTSTNATDIAQQNGYECPAGYYCPAGSAAELACPAGHYQEDLGASSPQDCIPCPASFFAKEAGSSSCRTCGGSSTSEGNATTCDCVGANRVYQAYTQACTCIPRYEYRASTWPYTVVSDEDGSANCTAIEYPSCTGFEVLNDFNFSEYASTLIAGKTTLKRNSDGVCVPEEYCPSCGAAGGIILADGLPCVCHSAQEDVVAAGDYCNGADGLICSTALSVTSSHGLELRVVLDNGTTLSQMGPVVAFSGRSRCQKTEGCAIATVFLTTGGMALRLAPVDGDDLYNEAVILLDELGVEVSTTTTTTTAATTVAPIDTTLLNLTSVNGSFLNATTAAATTTGFVDTCNTIYNNGASCDTFALLYPNNANLCPQLVAANYDCSGCSLIDCSCSLYGASKFPTCNGARHSCAALGNGVCDEDNNVESCSWDGGDCASMLNPLVCIEVGDAVLFDMAGSSNYPVYVRDSLLNTNREFDFSEFSLLAYNAKANEFQDNLLFFFEAEGTYVFATSVDEELQTVIKVGATSACTAFGGSGSSRRLATGPLSVTVVSFAALADQESLVSIGVGPDESIEVSPDWLLVAGTGGGVLFFLVVAIVIMLQILKAVRARSVYQKSNFKEGEEDTDVEQSIEEMVAAELRLEEIVAERELESKLAALVNKLRNHTDRSVDGFGNTTQNLGDLTETVRMESEVLRKLLAATILERGDPSHTQVALRGQIEAEVGAQSVNEGRFHRQLLTLVQLTTRLRDRLDPGAAVAARRIIQELTQGISANGDDGEGLHQDALRLKLDPSEELETMDELVQKIVGAAEKLKGLLADEKARSDVNESLFNTARYTHILPPASALSKSLSMLADVSVQMTHERESVSEMFDTFAKIGKESLEEIRKDHDPFEEKLIKAVELHNPGEVQSAKRGMYDSLSVNIQEIRAALTHLFQVLPKTRGNIHELVPHANACREMVREELARVEEEERAKRLAELDAGDSLDEAAREGDDIGRVASRKKGSDANGKALLLAEDPLLQQQQHMRELQELRQADDLHVSAMVDEMSADMDIALDRQLDTVEAMHGEQKSLLYDAMSANGQDDNALRQQLVDAFEADMSALASTLEDAKSSHLSKLKARLSDRAARKSAEAKQRQEDEKREVMLIEAQKDELTELKLEHSEAFARAEKELEAEGKAIVRGAVDDLQRKFDDEKRSIQMNYDDERNHIADEHFNEVAKMLGFSLDLAHEEEAALKERMAANRRDKEDRINRAFEAKLQVCQNKIDAFDADAFNSPEEAAVAIQLLEREKVGLQLEWEAALRDLRDELDSEERRVTQIARDKLIEKNRRQLEDFDKGALLLAEQEAELEGLKHDYDRQFDELAVRCEESVVEKQAALQVQIERRQAARLERVRKDQADEERALKRKTNVAISEVQDRLAKQQDNWWWEGNLDKAIAAARTGATGPDASPATKALAAAFAAKLEGSERLKELHEDIDDELEALHKKLHEEREAKLRVIDDNYVQRIGDLTEKLQALEAIDPIDEAAVATIKAEMAAAAALKHREKKEIADDDDRLRQNLAEQSLAKLEAARAQERETNSKRMLAAETALLQELVELKKIPPHAIGSAIQTMLEQRHSAERAEEMAGHFDENALRLRDFLQDRVQLKQAERMQFVSGLQATAEAKGQELSPRELKEKLREFDAQFDAATNHAQQALLMELSLGHEQRLQALQKVQVEEVGSVFKDIAPPDVLKAYLTSQASGQGAELTQFKQQMENQKLQRLEQIDASERSSKAALEAKQRAELDKMEADALRQLETGKKQSFERLEQQKQKMAKELEEAHRKKLATAGGDEAKALVMEQFRKDWRRIERTILAEKKRQEKQLRDGIMARQRRQRRRKEQELQEQLLKQERLAEESRRAVEEATAKTIAEKQAATVEIVTNMKQVAAVRGIPMGMVGKLSIWARKAKANLLSALDPEARRRARIQASNALRSGETAAPVDPESMTAATSNEDDGETKGTVPKSQDNAGTGGEENKLSPSAIVSVDNVDAAQQAEALKKLQDLTPLIDQLESIQKLLSSYAEKVGPQYEDPIDKANPTEGVLQPKDDSKLDRQAMLSLRYCRELAAAIGFSPVALQIRAASKLPTNSYEGNCYRNSFFLQFPDSNEESERPSSAGNAPILYIREQRLANPGQATTIAAHCLAHYIAGGSGPSASMRNDNDPRFLFHFFDNMRTLGQSMYEGGLRIGASSAPVSSSLDGDNETVDPAAQRTAQRKIQERVQRYASLVRTHQIESESNGLASTVVAEAANTVPAEILRSVGTGARRFVTSHDVETMSIANIEDRVDASFDLMVQGARDIASARAGIQSLEKAVQACKASGDVVKLQILREKLANQREALEDMLMGQETATVYSESMSRSSAALSIPELPPPPPGFRSVQGEDV